MTSVLGAPQIAVTLNNLTVSYRQHPALHHISGQFARGSLTAILGPNGAGKSTLLKSMAGLLPPDRHATSTRTGQDALQVHMPHQQLAYLPQQSEIDRSFPMDVGDCVLLGLWGSIGACGNADAGQLKQVQTALNAVGLQGFEHRPVGTLSTGQMQRMLFARLIVQDATLILLDEPFNAVDSKTSAALLDVVLQWHSEGRTVVAVLHDEAVVRSHFPHTLLLARECIAWGATANVLTPANQQRARAMAEAWDARAPLCDVEATKALQQRTDQQSPSVPHEQPRTATVGA